MTTPYYVEFKFNVQDGSGDDKFQSATQQLRGDYGASSDSNHAIYFMTILLTTGVGYIATLSTVLRATVGPTYIQLPDLRVQQFDKGCIRDGLQKWIGKHL